MGRNRKDSLDPDRYLLCLNGNYYYRRRTPVELRDVDPRGHTVKLSLKTDDLARARSFRDFYEKADDELWASMIDGGDAELARGRYQAAIQRAKALGFSYKPASEVATDQIDAILERVESLAGRNVPKPVVQAVLGTVEMPAVKISKAFEVYRDKIVPHQLRSKSAGQRKRWTNVKHLAVKHFMEIVGDLDIEKIGRDDARKYYDHWMEKIAPKVGKPSHSPDTGKRRVGDLRVLYREYFAHLGDKDRDNPFDGLTFKRKGGKRRKRLAFDHDWIVGTILRPGALAGLNEEARGVLLMVADIGARPSEICNLIPERILLKHKIPHLKIEPDDDPDAPREIKTESSIRFVPLTGLALEVMKKHPHGFPRYRDKEDTLSATLNKYLRENKLAPTENHSVYSLRHSFEGASSEAPTIYRRALLRWRSRRAPSR